MAYVSHFCIRKTDRNPRSPIKQNQQFLILGLAAVVLTATLLPGRASAFWPFSTRADAAVAANGPYQTNTQSFVQAATNIDPNPNKGLGDNIATSGGKALIAYTGPSGTIADVSDSIPSDRISVYVVRKGDTLSDIAKMFEVSVNTIIWANNLSGIKDVHPDDTLIILPVSGVKRTVIKGDTLKSVAKKYGGDALEIAQYNGLDSSEPLEVGSTIIIPGGEVSTPTPAPVKYSVPTTGNNDSFVAGSGYYSNPLPGGIITQRLHDGRAVDIGAARGTPIHAAADGTIIIVRNNGGWNGGYGNYVVITHGNGTQTLYSHLRSSIVSAGQRVSNGQIIGYIGATGRATGPHLHFEVRGAANPFRHCSVGSVCSPR